jgi:hypothetical protein
MNTNTWIDRLYEDEGLTDGLADDDAELLLSWAENRLATCESDQDALHLFDALRLLSRYVEEGENFDHLFAALKANSTGQADPATETIYPPEP